MKREFRLRAFLVAKQRFVNDGGYISILYFTNLPNANICKSCSMMSNPLFIHFREDFIHLNWLNCDEVLQEKLRLLDTPKTHHDTMSWFYQSKKGGDETTAYKTNHVGLYNLVPWQHIQGSKGHGLP